MADNDLKAGNNLKLGMFFEGGYTYDNLTGAPIYKNNHNSGLALHNSEFAVGPSIEWGWIDMQLSARYSYTARNFEYYKETIATGDGTNETDTSEGGLTALPGGTDVDDTVGSRSNSLQYHRLGVGLTLLTNSQPLKFSDAFGLDVGLSGAYYFNVSDSAVPGFEKVDGKFIPANYDQTLGNSGNVALIVDAPLFDTGTGFSLHVQGHGGVEFGNYKTLKNSEFVSPRAGIRLTGQFSGVEVKFANKEQKQD